MSRSSRRLTVTWIVLGLAAATLLFLMLFGPGEPSPERSGPAPTTDSAEPATGSVAEPLAADSAAAELATDSPEAGQSERREVPARTWLSGRFLSVQGGWSPGGQVELRTYADPPPGGMMGFADAGMQMADSGGDGRGEIEAWLGRGAVFGTTDVRADGSFQIHNPPAGRFALQLRHPSQRLVDARVLEVEIGDQQDLGLIRTSPAASVLVLVSDRDGQPIEQASVSLGQEFDQARFADPAALGNMTALIGELIPHEARTDARGSCRFDSIDPAKNWFLKVEVREFVDETRALRLAIGRENIARFELSAGATLRVKVLDPDGSPHPGARLELRFPNLGGPAGMEIQPMGMQQGSGVPSYSLVCDAEGLAERPGLPVARGDLQLQTPGFLRREQSLRLLADEVTYLELQLDAGLAVRGRVIDEDGEPRPEAHVLNVPMLGQEIMGFDMGDMIGAEVLGLDSEHRGVPCDQQGRFVLGGFEPGELAQLMAVAPGYDPAVQKDVAPDSEVELVLREQCALSGRVLSDDGEPVTDFTASLKKRAFMVMDRTLRKRRIEGSEDGSFEIAPCPRDKVQLVIEAKGFARFTHSANLSDGSLDLGELRLTRPAAVAGTVIDPDGLPIAGALVRVSKGGMFDSQMMAQMLGERRIESDEHGRFRIDELGGRAVRLVAEAEGLAPVKSPAIRLISGETIEGVVLQLERGGVIRGLLLDADDRPLVDWRVQVAQASGAAVDFEASDAEGRFTFEGLAGGTYKVDAYPLDAVDGRRWAMDDPDEGFDLSGLMSEFLAMSVSDRVVVRAGETIELTLVHDEADALSEGLVELRGRIRVGGEALDAGTVMLIRPGQMVPRHLAPIADGAFTVPAVEPGSWNLQIQSGLFSGMVGQGQLIEIPEGATHDLVLDLPGGTLAGRVLDENGDGAEGCVVTLSNPDLHTSGGGERLDLGEGTVLTEADGHFRFTALPPGEYGLVAKQVLSLAAIGQAGRIEAVSLGVDQLVDELEIRLDRGGILQVAVRDQAGARGNALVTLLAADGAPIDLFHRTLTRVDGTVEFAGLPPGNYRVTVDAPGAAPQVSAPVQLPTRGQQRIEVTIRRGRELHLRLQGEIPAATRGELLVYSLWQQDGTLLRSGRLLIPRQLDDDSRRVPLGRLDPGRYRLILESPTLGLLRLERELSADGPAEWSIDLARQG